MTFVESCPSRLIELRRPIVQTIINTIEVSDVTISDADLDRLRETLLSSGR